MLESTSSRPRTEIELCPLSRRDTTKLGLAYRKPYSSRQHQLEVSAATLELLHSPSEVPKGQITIQAPQIEDYSARTRTTSTRTEQAPAWQSTSCGIIPALCFLQGSFPKLVRYADWGNDIIDHTTKDTPSHPGVVPSAAEDVCKKLALMDCDSTRAEVTVSNGFDDADERPEAIGKTSAPETTILTSNYALEQPVPIEPPSSRALVSSTDLNSTVEGSGVMETRTTQEMPKIPINLATHEATITEKSTSGSLVSVPQYLAHIIGRSKVTEQPTHPETTQIAPGRTSGETMITEPPSSRGRTAGSNGLEHTLAVGEGIEEPITQRAMVVASGSAIEQAALEEQSSSHGRSMISMGLGDATESSTTQELTSLKTMHLAPERPSSHSAITDLSGSRRHSTDFQGISQGSEVTARTTPLQTTGMAMNSPRKETGLREQLTSRGHETIDIAEERVLKEELNAHDPGTSAHTRIHYLAGASTEQPSPSNTTMTLIGSGRAPGSYGTMEKFTSPEITRDPVEHAVETGSLAKRITHHDREVGYAINRFEFMEMPPRLEMMGIALGSPAAKTVVAEPLTSSSLSTGVGSAFEGPEISEKATPRNTRKIAVSNTMEHSAPPGEPTCSSREPSNGIETLTHSET